MSYQSFSDDELVYLIKDDNRNAFNEIYYRYSEPLYRFAYNILQNEDECMDAVQEVFVWFWQNRERLEIKTLKSYLFAAVKYKLTRVIYNSRRQAEILAAAPDIKEVFMNDELEIKELKEAISQFIKTLPVKARQIFELSRHHYLTNKEIAAQLGISEKTVENQITISLKKLRLSLGKNSFLSIFL